MEWTLRSPPLLHRMMTAVGLIGLHSFGRVIPVPQATYILLSLAFVQARTHMRIKFMRVGRRGLPRPTPTRK